MHSMKRQRGRHGGLRGPGGPDREESGMFHGGGRGHRHGHGDFFVVRALRRRGIGHEVIRRVLADQPGPWVIGFQDDNPGAREFWTAVATEAVGDAWTLEHHPVPGLPHLPPDSFIGFTVPG